MKKKIIGIFVCMLFIGTVLSVTGTVINIDRTPLSIITGKTLYVGGSGEGNYTNVQDAIDNASDGDTVFVYDDSSPYVENIIVDKSINIIGENKQTTVIDGNRNGDVIEVFADFVKISGFTLQNSSQNPENLGAGININSDNCIIIDNIFIHNFRKGVEIINADNCYISKNFFSFNHHGISIADSYQVTVEDNIIENSSYVGIGIYRNKKETKILKNTLINNEDGVYIFNIQNSVIIKNNVIMGNKKGIYNDAGADNRKKRCYIFENQISSNNEYGIYMETGKGNLIFKNNFENNEINAFMELYWRSDIGLNRWSYLLKGNYWDDWSGSGLKIINGEMFLTLGLDEDIVIPWINIDFFPSKRTI